VPQDTPNIEYPCRWEYRIIGASEDGLRAAAVAVAGELDYSLHAANVSSRGRYLSLRLEVLVHNDRMRVSLFEQLRAREEVMMVL